MASFSLSSLLPPVFAKSLYQKDFKIAPGIYFTTGFKTAEVSSNSTLLWTRLCAQSKPNPVVHKRQEQEFHNMEVYKNILEYYGVILLFDLLLILERRRNSDFQ